MYRYIVYSSLALGVFCENFKALHFLKRSFKKVADSMRNDQMRTIKRELFCKVEREK